MPQNVLNFADHQKRNSLCSQPHIYHKVWLERMKTLAEVLVAS